MQLFCNFIVDRSDALKRHRRLFDLSVVLIHFFIYFFVNFHGLLLVTCLLNKDKRFAPWLYAVTAVLHLSSYEP